MEIIQVGSCPPPFGGQSVHIKALQDFLNIHDHHCTIFNTGGNKAIKNEHVVNIQSTKDLAGKLWSTQRDTLIHLHIGKLGHLGKVFACGFVNIIKRKKLVITIHSGSFLDDYNDLNDLKKYLLLRILKSCQRIISVNEKIKTGLMEKGIEPGKVLIIPAFSLSIDFTNINTNKNVEEFFQHHSPVVSCVGFFEPQYGLELAVDAVAELKGIYPEIGIIIMASGKDEASFLTHVEKCGCQNEVMVLNNESRDQCLLILAKSDLFLRPTKYDGDAISVREALALGTTVVASKTDFRPEGAILFKNGDLKDLIYNINSHIKPAVSKESDIKPVQKTEYLQAVLHCYLDI